MRPGQLCLASAACLFAGPSTLHARAVTTAPTTLTVLPAPAFREALAHGHFRDFVLGPFAARMVELTTLVEAVAFQRLDARVAAALLGRCAVIRTTHQALADELGTVREMITRLLHRFEHAGLVALSRECITLRDAARLRALAQGAAGAM